MKNKLKLIVAAFLLLSVASCDKGLEELNRNQVNPTTIDPSLLLNQAMVNSSFPFKSVIFDMGIVQQIVSPNGGVIAGANFNQDSRDVTIPPLWAVYYQNVIKYTKDAINISKDEPTKANLYNMSRIYQAFAFMVLTDEYGDIPYTEGGAGYTDQIFLPRYDRQEDIYNDIIKELTEAGAALSASSPIITSDLLYAGDIDKWKKFANSLLLRAGMRLIKVDPSRAQAVASAAIAAGVITNNADNAYIRHDANYQNPISGGLNGSEASNFYLTKPFVDQLKNSNDPRLSSIAVRYVGATSGNGQTAAAANTSAGVQIGMPMGYDNGTIPAQATADGLASFYDYSQADRTRILNIVSPAFLVTASQTLLLMAEARFRGWISSSTAAQYYADGIRAHIDQMAIYNPSMAISATDRENFVSSHPLTPGSELEDINTQYWISSFLNGPEAFANFRRSGFPDLTPNPYGQPNNPDVPNGTFARRLTYPTSELSVNTENVNAAIAVQGPDELSTRVWWDQ